MASGPECRQRTGGLSSTAAGPRAASVYLFNPDRREESFRSMKAYALPKTMLLVKPWQYGQVYDQGKRVRGQNFSLIHVPNNTAENRLGISIHGIRQAVQRNRLKRIIREFFRQNKAFIAPSSDVVFAVRPGFVPKTPREVEAAVRVLLSRRKAGGRAADPDEGTVKPS
jgi:ribonuclease P protein component